MTKVKVFVYERRRQRRQRQQRRGYDNSSPDFRHGELKIVKIFIFIPDVSTKKLTKFGDIFFIILLFITQILAFKHQSLLYF